MSATALPATVGLPSAALEPQTAVVAVSTRDRRPGEPRAGEPGAAELLTAALVGEIRDSALLLGMLLVVLGLAAGLGSSLLLLG
jgi:hypothetical protein